MTRSARVSGASRVDPTFLPTRLFMCHAAHERAHRHGRAGLHSVGRCSGLSSEIKHKIAAPGGMT